MFKTYVSRDKYLDKIKPFMDKDIIKVIIGQRRVGKSYFQRQIMDFLKNNRDVKDENIIYVNKELHEFETIKTHSDLMKHIASKVKGKKKYYVFVDEVQEIESFEKALESLQASGNFDIYCTGSNSNLLSSELATFLSGRFVEIKIFSLSYDEFLIFHALENNNESFLKYIKYGGMPFLRNLELTDETVYEYLRNIYSTILFKDIVQKYSVRNVNFLERLVEYLADNTGSLVSAKSISDFLKSQKLSISPSVILNYLSHLAGAMFIFKVRRSDIFGKRVFEIREKYYFEDLGLRHSIIGYKHPDIGKILENMVYIHLKINGYTVTVGEFKNTEIDFVAEKGGKRIYVQVAYLLHDKKTVEREYGNLLAINDNYPKYIVSMDEGAGGGEKGIEHVNIRNFLSKQC
ncbi:MAG: ATP-binding protein [Candidatus Omnitrophica bacterium]|nr:ATP-binding protein [Candidatus Omnitrophota bacterium]